MQVMTTVTIPKKLTKGEDLVVIPRKKYEEFLRVFEKRGYSRLDRDLDKAIMEYREGKFFGPFRTAKDGVKFLKSRRSSRIGK